METIIRIPRAVMVALMGGDGPVDVAILIWAFAVVAWAVLTTAAILRYAWRR